MGGGFGGVLGWVEDVEEEVAVFYADHIEDVMLLLLCSAGEKVLDRMIMVDALMKMIL